MGGLIKLFQVILSTLMGIFFGAIVFHVTVMFLDGGGLPELDASFFANIGSGLGAAVGFVNGIYTSGSSGGHDHDDHHDWDHGGDGGD